MADTKPLVPTDAEIDAEWRESVAKHETTEAFVRDFARAVLAKWGAQPVPSGYALVPVKPTDAMVQAAHHLDLSYMPGHEGADRAAIYRAMIAAAPQPVVREAFHKDTGCTPGGDINLAERVCGVVERAHGITTTGRKDAP